MSQTLKTYLEYQSESIKQLLLAVHEKLAAEILFFGLSIILKREMLTKPSLLFAENCIADWLISRGITDCGCLAVPSFLHDIPEMLLLPGEPSQVWLVRGMIVLMRERPAVRVPSAKRTVGEAVTLSIYAS